MGTFERLSDNEYISMMNAFYIAIAGLDAYSKVKESGGNLARQLMENIRAELATEGMTLEIGQELKRSVSKTHHLTQLPIEISRTS